MSQRTSRRVPEPPSAASEVAPGEWKSLLLGPRGVLTEIFNAVKDKVQDQYHSDVQKMHNDMEQAKHEMTPGERGNKANKAP